MKSSLTHLKNHIDYGLLLAVAIPLVALMPLLVYAGLPNTADGPAHLMRQVELNQAWSQGNFYPRWGTDLALGHGMPIFSYAPPWLYHLTQLFHLTGWPLDTAMKAVLILDFILYSVGMFLFVRRVYGPYPALLSAALYVYTPYRLREVYIQGNYGQFSGLAFYPFILWGFYGLIIHGKTRYWVAASVSLAGLLLSHNISSMLFMPLLALYLLFLLALQFYQTKKNIDTSANLRPVAYAYPLLRTVGAGLLGLALSAIFWLPAFGERHDIKLEGITQGFFDFRENFISLSEFLSRPIPLDLTAINPEFPLSLGLPQLLGALTGLLTFLYMTYKLIKLRPTSHVPPRIYLHTLFFTLFFLLYTFLTLPISQTVWENVPLLELTEFPWRMLGPTIFCATVLAGATLYIIYEALEKNQVPFSKVRARSVGVNISVQTNYAPTGLAPTPPSNLKRIQNQRPGIRGQELGNNQTQNKEPRTPLVIFMGVLLMIIGLNAYYLYPSQFISWGTPTPAEAFAYEVTSGAIGTTSTGEFLPRWAKWHPHPDTLWPDYEASRPPQVLDPTTLPANATAQTTHYLAESASIIVNSPAAFEATLRTLYWPGWQLYLNNTPHPFTITPHTGLIQTTIPAGQHILNLQLESTPLRSIGLWLTVSAVLIIVALIIIALIGKKPTANRQQPDNKRVLSKSKGEVSRIEGLDANKLCSDLPRPYTTCKFEEDTNKLSGQTFLITTGLLLALYLFSRPLAPLFVLQSDPNQPLPVARPLQVDFADQIRLVGVDTWPAEIQLPTTGHTDLTATLYWKAQQVTAENYSVFLHLDAPNGQTLATVDEVSPENIPTRNWPPGLYLRNPLHLKIPADLPPIRYTLTTGVYHQETGQRLPLAFGEGDTFSLGEIWLTPPSTYATPSALATFGPHITLHQADFANNIVTLQWQTSQPIAQNYSIFVHLLDTAGKVIAQADGVPYQGLYPLPHWLPNQLIQDIRAINSPQPPAAIALGIYDPATSQRLPVVDAQGLPQSNHSYLIPVTP